MKKKCIVFGINEFAVMVQEYISRFSDMEVVAYTANREFLEYRMLGKLPVVAFEDVMEEYSPEEYSMIITAGYKGMNELRKQIFLKAKKMGYKIENFIHPTVYIDGNEIGEGNIIFENVTITRGAKLGNANIIWNGCHISHDSQIGDFNFMGAASLLAGKVTVKNNCFLCHRSTINGGVTVEDYTLVGANAFLAKNSEAYGVYMPARTVQLQLKKSTDMI